MKIEDIENPDFLATLSKKELKQLCQDIREFLIESISHTGGHLASNLGVVELSVGLHYIFNNKNDKFIFDVGHQAYIHKILTGRAKEFSTLRQTNGLSGFTSYEEGDSWESGHSSNSISAMAGFLVSKKNGNKEINDVVSIIGDSSIANGMAFEGLNFVATLEGQRPIIILNDNKMGISKSVGATTRLFNVMRRSRFYRGLKAFLIRINPKFIVHMFHQIKNSIKALLQNDNIFEDLGYDYYGPYDGNDLPTVIRVLDRAKRSKKPCVVHFFTKKGLGYDHAEMDEKGSFHGIGKFDVKSGKPLKVYEENEFSYSEIIARALIEERENSNITVINPATLVGNRLSKFQRQFPNSIYDVGIAEEHAATMAGALALNNESVALLMYSTFAQRSYDQILNDIARRNLHVVMGFDRAGLVPEDGSTHQGIYDIAMLNSMPNIKICMGKDLAEAKALMHYAFKLDGPVVVRYPKMNEIYKEDIKVDSMDWELLTKGKDVIVISYGPEVLRIKKIIDENNLNISLINARFIRPIDKNMLNEISASKKILVVEEAIRNASLASLITDYYRDNSIKANVISHSIDPDSFVPQASYNDLLKIYKLDDKSLKEELVKLCD